MESKKLVVVNLKMNQTIDQVSTYLDVIDQSITTDQVIICPTSIYLPYFLKKKYRVGIQNTFFRSEGSYTGEISPKQVRSMGVTYTILGHSERRIYFNETDTTINKKILEALKFHLHVILCIGENKEERNLLKTDRVLKRQILNGLRGIPKEILPNIIIAYEPVHIGIDFSLNDIENNIRYIRELIQLTYQIKEIKIIYGGEIEEKSIKKINQIKEIDGFLISHNILDPHQLLKIISSIID